MIDHICQGCGKDFQTDSRKHKYCSQQCYHDTRKGESHPHYKGGRIGRGGYRIICINGKQCFEHRHLMSQEIDRPLLAHEHVHHKDGNPSNNVMSNLELVTHTEHQRLHHSFLYRDDESRQCCRCHQIKTEGEFNKKQNACRSCQHEYYAEHAARRKAKSA